MKTVYASSVATLDSDVWQGGGTDVTEALQAVLDEAKDGTGIHLVMDGAALVRGLKVHSNTTVRCLSKDCGFYLKDGSDAAVITNADWAFDGERRNRNITLIGGTYNGNCRHQAKAVDMGFVFDKPWKKYCDFSDNAGSATYKCVHGIEFFGVEQLTVQGIIIRDSRTYAFTMGNFFRVTLEDIWLDLPHKTHADNQDGFHFWGPGQFLTVKNVGGDVSDDFMNIGPDERDKESSITDVLVDGVFLNDADQAIRLLSRGTGRLDRVTIRNVTGTYRSYGFYIGPWFMDDTFGNFGTFTFENIDLRAVGVDYHYRPAVLFALGGDIECAIFRNITHRSVDTRSVFEVGPAFHLLYDPFEETLERHPRIRNCIIDGLTVVETEPAPPPVDYIQLSEAVGTLVIRNALVLKDPETDLSRSRLLSIWGRGAADTLILQDVHVEGAQLISGADKIKNQLS